MSDDATELHKLRLGIQRVAEMTRSSDVTAFIPKSVEVEQGWNRLCAVLCDWIEDERRMGEVLRAAAPGSSSFPAADPSRDEADTGGA
jgi:hypothetical protein